ncbi:MAG: TlpA family protein disulfide reductase, partial [Deltaproteobacteria bacterium]|nr:TlpA family protein disulfide reductase [Deltaproteobacteria bacterium]
IVKESEGAVMVVLAAWCFPCLQELPTLVKLHDKYKSQGLEMVGISVDRGGPYMIQQVRDKGHVNFPVYWAGEEAVRALDIRAIPLLFLVKDGEVVQEIMGKQSEAFLEKKITQLLKKPVPPPSGEDQKESDNEVK